MSETARDHRQAYTYSERLQRNSQLTFELDSLKHCINNGLIDEKLLVRHCRFLFL